MATHFSALAWRIPGTGEPGGLPSIGSHRAGHDWCDLAAAARLINVPGHYFFDTGDENLHAKLESQPHARVHTHTHTPPHRAAPPLP